MSDQELRGDRAVARLSANIFSRFAVRAVLLFASLFLFGTTALVAAPTGGFDFRVLTSEPVCLPTEDVEDPEYPGLCLQRMVSEDVNLQSCLVAGNLAKGKRGFGCWWKRGNDLEFGIAAKFTHDQLGKIGACLAKGWSAMLRNDMITCKTTPTSLGKALEIAKWDFPLNTGGGGSGGGVTTGGGATGGGGEGGSALGGECSNRSGAG